MNRLTRATAVEPRFPRQPACPEPRADLRYVSDEAPGYTRRRCGRGWLYLDQFRRRLPEGEVARAASLVIPPAWKNVWICPDPQGHIQATGRDARGRKQYIYHPAWRAGRDESKFDRMIPFGERLPGIREQVDRDLALPRLCRRRVLAAVIRLLEASLIRVGSDAYARHNRTYGLTTLRTEHAIVNGGAIRFQFRGKSGKEFDVTLRDRRLARLLRRCQELPGQELLQYLDESGRPHPITSEMVNQHLRELSGGSFSAKDFRTWGGTLLAFEQLRSLDPPSSTARAKRDIAAAVRYVAAHLNNTAAVCRASYIHPEVLAAFEEGSLAAFHTDQVSELAQRRRTGAPEVAEAEWALLVFLRGRLARRIAA